MKVRGDGDVIFGDIFRNLEYLLADRLQNGSVVSGRYCFGKMEIKEDLMVLHLLSVPISIIMFFDFLAIYLS